MLWRKPRANAPFGPSISVTLPTMARQNGICRLVSRPLGRRIRRVVSAPASDRIALMDRNDENGAICPPVADLPIVFQQQTNNIFLCHGCALNLQFPVPRHL